MQVAVGGSHFKIPWSFVVGILLAAVAGLVVALLMLVVFSGPSDADLAVRAMAGDQEAAEELESKYTKLTPVPKPLFNPEDVHFTPGVYTRVNPKATDGAEITASFLMSYFNGNVEDTQRFIADPTAPGWAPFFDEVRAYIGPSIVKVSITELGFSPIVAPFSDERSSIVEGDVYEVYPRITLDNGEEFFSATISLVMLDGKWKISSPPLTS